MKQIPDPTQDQAYHAQMSQPESSEDAISNIREEMVCCLDQFYIRLTYNEQCALDEALWPFAEAIHEQNLKDEKSDY